MSKYRKSWSQALYEVFNKEVDLEEIELSKEDAASFCSAASKAKEQGKKTFKMGGKEYPVTIKVKIPEETIGDILDQIVEDSEIDEWVIEESAGLQLKMAFDDAKIKIKGVKSGKLVISKKDKKEVEKIIAKQMKKPADAKRVLGSQIVFEDVELNEKSKLHPDLVKIDKEIDKLHNKTKHMKYLSGKERDQMTKLSKERDAIYQRVKNEEVELAEKGTAYPATVDTLRKIVKDKQHQTVMFDKGQAIVDLFSASAMVQVYDALKPATKKKFEDMIKSKEGFMKSQAFAMKMAK